jgi:hypothetical protein
MEAAAKRDAANTKAKILARQKEIEAEKKKV